MPDSCMSELERRPSSFPSFPSLPPFQRLLWRPLCCDFDDDVSLFSWRERLRGPSKRHHSYILLYSTRLLYLSHWGSCRVVLWLWNCDDLTQLIFLSIVSLNAFTASFLWTLQYSTLINVIFRTIGFIMFGWSSNRRSSRSDQQQPQTQISNHESASFSSRKCAAFFNNYACEY